jgi:hypothetical protein
MIPIAELYGHQFWSTNEAALTWIILYGITLLWPRCAGFLRVQTFNEGQKEEILLITTQKRCKGITKVSCTGKKN